jgi:hypothetical protein
MDRDFADGMMHDSHDWSSLRGNCVVCGRWLAEADYDRQAVVAAIGPEGTVICCRQHVDPGPGTAEYDRAVRAMAAAKAAQIKANQQKP